MKEQVLNEIVKFDSTAEYYQQLEKSILGNQSCYEATVVDGELLGMKVLVEGKHPVGLYLPNATDERRQKAEQMILDYVADPDYFERYMSIGAAPRKAGKACDLRSRACIHCAASACENGWL